MHTNQHLWEKLVRLENMLLLLLQETGNYNHNSDLEEDLAIVEKSGVESPG